MFPRRRRCLHSNPGFELQSQRIRFTQSGVSKIVPAGHRTISCRTFVVHGSGSQSTRKVVTGARTRAAGRMKALGFLIFSVGWVPDNQRPHGRVSYSGIGQWIKKQTRTVLAHGLIRSAWVWGERCL